MRIRGTGNILMLEGTLDTPANKKFWGTHGPRALSLIKAARAEHAQYRADAAAAAAEMDAFMCKRVANRRHISHEARQ